MKDTIIFLIINIPFILAAYILLRDARRRLLTKPITIVIILMYVITIISSIAKLGDNFGWFQYFSMYVLIPLIYFYCKCHNYKSLNNSILASIFVVFPITIAVGAATLFVALMILPPDFR